MRVCQTSTTMLIMNKLIIDKNCQKCINRVGWFGIWTSVLLAFLQGAVGFLTGSTACLAIALQSICNVITAGAIIITQKVSSKPANEEFPLGYGKVEFIAAGFTCLLFGCVAAVVSYMALQQLMRPAAAFDFTPILVAVVSIIANELLFYYMRCVATQAKSQSIMANAWTNRADSYASAVVAVCAFGSWMGLPRLDSLAAFIVVALIVKVLFKVFMEALRGLMDSSVNPLYKDKVETIASAVVGVKGVRKVRTKQVGRKIWAELDVIVDPDCSIQDAQTIAAAVKKALLARIEEMEEALVNFKPVQAGR